MMGQLANPTLEARGMVWLAPNLSRFPCQMNHIEVTHQIHVFVDLLIFVLAIQHVFLVKD